jgi:hypothetical protein
MTTGPDPSRGDEHHHPDGTVEILFATEDDQAVQGAAYQGINEAVAGLPPAAIYRRQDSTGSFTTEQNDPSE